MAYHDDGFFVVRGLFSDSSVRDAIDAILEIVKSNLPCIQYEVNGVAHAPFDQRLPMVRKLQGYVQYDDRLKAISEDAGLLGVVRDCLAAEPELIVDNALLKPPRIGREKPWHQDNATLKTGTDVVGTWIALDAATVDNGCMHMIPGSHKFGEIEHARQQDAQLYLASVPAEKVVAVEMEPGDCLVWNGLTHHGSPANKSLMRRWALQFHYKPKGTAR